MIGCGGVGMSAILGAVAVGAAPILAVDLDEEKLELALSLGATDAVPWAGGPEATAERVQSATGGVDYAIEATGRTEAALAAFLSTRPRGAAVLIGIPSADAVLSLPAQQIPRSERRVLGSLTARPAPSATSPPFSTSTCADGSRSTASISARLPLEAVEQAFDALRTATALRTVLELDGAAA